MSRCPVEPVPERYIGLISGTSMDGADAALVEFRDGPPRLVAALTLPYPEALRADVDRAADPRARLDAGTYGFLDARLGDHFARAALAVLEAAGHSPDGVRAIGSHGQTVAHDAGAEPAYSVQLGDPNRIAERTGITTVADFRRRDLAAGGQGAPLMSAFHAAALREPGRRMAVLNVGGIANLTLLPAGGGEPVAGFDSGPGNCLLDQWARRHLGRDFDRGGAWAASGRADAALLERLLDEAYFRAPTPKSTGTQHFDAHWLEARLQGSDATPEDVAATLVALTAATVKRALEEAGFIPERLMVCGGGAHNEALMLALRDALPATAVATTAEVGVDPDWVEAAGFAWLARQALAGQPGNLPSVTGAAGPRVLGAVYPGGGKRATE